ncbi:C6 transcription factor OefC [Verticillium alfalfae VaMs.102]|uniref:C6 transcription factor OefC n=1 Tax=Verticillium alfalfae (strain VaMs.102 / ATCC MYA-4576 / FGSC 10136) TaxID=526221 RepID=C9SFL9_VERA1|nr:C6 transcription factor OefC [Verticillium alfalfae VaMs.102]EEY17352.1 C6 transcription factor OefC [Verticillium alfalfae VaMs.102]
MDSASVPVQSDEGDASWSDNHSMYSIESMHDDACQPQSPASDSAQWNLVESSLPTGHLSPISTGMDTSSNSGPSTHDTSLAMPKLEPLDEDFCLDNVTEAPAADLDHGNASSTNPKLKRPRGRPRKHPLNSAINAGKVTKGRSKTGCITCRKRKKKCDEAKPRCYHEKKLWRSGKDKASDDHTEASEDAVVFHMQPLFHGVVTVEDRLFWKHYYMSLSNVLTVEGEAKNAFKDIILPLANKHQGVMHSVLAMSSKHIDYDTPYGAKLLQQNPGTSRAALQSRADYHHQAAMDSFYADIQRSADEGEIDQKTILSARYAQILCLLIGTLIEGNPHGEHRVHLRGYQLLIQQNPPEDPTYLAFITEFFQYHIYADELVRHPGMNGPRLTCQDWTPLASAEAPRLLGVSDGLFQHLPQVAAIKDTIRQNIYNGAETRVDYHLLWRAQEIQEAIEQWSPTWPAGDSRHRVGLVYKHMMFLHLFRTIYPPTTSQQVSMPPLAPPAAPVSPAASRRPSQVSRPLTASSCSSSPGLGPTTASVASMTFQQRSPPGSRNPSRTSSMHELDSSAASGLSASKQQHLSPPPVRRSPHHDRRITAAVDESLTMMEGFKPFDPALTLLLVPCQIIGAACFDHPQQERVRGIIRQVRGYTGLRNCDRTSEVLEEVWRLMDEGDWLSAWDWQGVALKIGADFLCT